MSAHWRVQMFSKFRK